MEALGDRGTIDMEDTKTVTQDKPLIEVPSLVGPLGHHLKCGICQKLLTTEETSVKKAIKALTTKYCRHVTLRHPEDIKVMQELVGRALKAIDVILTFSNADVDEGRNTEEFVKAFMEIIEMASKDLMEILDWEEGEEEEEDDEEDGGNEEEDDEEGEEVKEESRE